MLVLKNRRLVFAAVVPLLGVCGEAAPPLPLTAAEAASMRTGATLAAYLGQTDASAAVARRVRRC